MLERLDTGEQWVVDPDPAVRIALLRALETLPQRQRAAVTLRYLLDWSAADVAEVMGTNENTVRSLAHRGLARLRQYFDEPTTASTTRTRRAGVIGLVALVAVAATALALAFRTETPSGVFIDPPPDESPLDSMDDLGGQDWTTVAEGSLGQARSWVIDVAAVAGEICVRVSVASQPLDFLTDWAISCRPPLGEGAAGTLAVDVGFADLVVGRLSDDIAEVRARFADGEGRLADVVEAPDQRLRLFVVESPIGEDVPVRLDGVDQDGRIATSVPVSTQAEATGQLACVGDPRRLHDGALGDLADELRRLTVATHGLFGSEEVGVSEVVRAADHPFLRDALAGCGQESLEATALVKLAQPEMWAMVSASRSGWHVRYLDDPPAAEGSVR